MAHPRTVNGAVKRGWTTIRIKRQADLSWFGIINVIKRNIQGHEVHEYDAQGGGWVAYEYAHEATYAILRFNAVVK